MSVPDKTRYSGLTRWAGRDKSKLGYVAKEMGYKPGWAYHRAKALRAQEIRDIPPERTFIWDLSGPAAAVT